LAFLVASASLLAPSAMRLTSPVKVAFATPVQRASAPSLMLREMTGRPSNGLGRWDMEDKYGTGYGPWRNNMYSSYGGGYGDTYGGGYGMGGYGGYGMGGYSGGYGRMGGRYGGMGYGGYGMGGYGGG